MARLHYANYLNTNDGNFWQRIFTFSITDWRVSAYSLIVISFFLILFSSRSHADEFTGLPHDDPKDLTVAPPTESSSCASPTISTANFAPLPGWAHGATLGALPYQLTPMGKKPATTTTAAAGTGSEPLAPPKDNSPAVLIPGPAPETKPAAAPEPPALIAVSPFLQWVKSNPQAAAAQARQQAASENAASTPPAPTTAPTANQPIPQTTSPYWLPPLIDSGEFGTQTSGSSAAIYMTPQR